MCVLRERVSVVCANLCACLPNVDMRVIHKVGGWVEGGVGVGVSRCAYVGELFCAPPGPNSAMLQQPKPLFVPLKHPNLVQTRRPEHGISEAQTSALKQ